MYKKYLLKHCFYHGQYSTKLLPCIFSEKISFYINIILIYMKCIRRKIKLSIRILRKKNIFLYKFLKIPINNNLILLDY